MTRKPLVVTPFGESTFTALQAHVREVRRLFDWPGIPYHDADNPPESKFNRWSIHNSALLRYMHNDPDFINLANDIFKCRLKPSYAFLSMYGPDGICPEHMDRPQCFATIDLLVNDYLKRDAWPIHIETEGVMKAYELDEGEAICYSGQNQKHYREKMTEEHGPQDLVFFHFVPATFTGPLD